MSVLCLDVQGKLYPVKQRRCPPDNSPYPQRGQCPRGFAAPHGSQKLSLGWLQRELGGLSSLLHRTCKICPPFQIWGVSVSASFFWASEGLLSSAHAGTRKRWLKMLLLMRKKRA